MHLTASCLEHQSPHEALEIACAWAIATRALYWYQRPFRRWLFSVPFGVKVSRADIGDDEAIS